MYKSEDNLDALLKARAEIDKALRKHKAASTVMFTDVVGSTSYFDRYGDTAGVAMLHRHTDVAIAIVEKHAGTVIKTIGDSVMADFPEPLNAVRAAIEVQQQIHAANETAPQRERILIRIGIHTGEVFRRSDDVYGDTVNMAARVTKTCAPAQILISRPVRESITDKGISCMSIGRLTVSGKSEKEELFEVLWTDATHYSEIRLSLASPVQAARNFDRGDEPTTDISAGDRFHILDQVGSGGAGIVYKAHDRETNAIVALKVLHPQIAAEPGLIERFKFELLIARKITHKNVCRVYDLNRFEKSTIAQRERRFVGNQHGNHRSFAQRLAFNNDVPIDDFAFCDSHIDILTPPAAAVESCWLERPPNGLALTRKPRWFAAIDHKRVTARLVGFSALLGSLWTRAWIFDAVFSDPFRLLPTESGNLTAWSPPPNLSDCRNVSSNGTRNVRHSFGPLGNLSRALLFLGVEERRSARSGDLPNGLRLSGRAFQRSAPAACYAVRRSRLLACVAQAGFVTSRGSK